MTLKDFGHEEFIDCHSFKKSMETYFGPYSDQEILKPDFPHYFVINLRFNNFLLPFFWLANTAKSLLVENRFDALGRISQAIDRVQGANQQFQQLVHNVIVFNHQMHVSIFHLNSYALPRIKRHLVFRNVNI